MAGLLDFIQGASNAAASNVSAPVDGIAWLLRKAGVPIPDAPVGGSDWMAQKGLTKPANGMAGLLGETAGGLAPILAAAKAPQIAQGLLKAGDNLAAPRTLNPQTGAIVWHGSPHKFSMFDSSKIGTGEGAQAYGHGLYLAESPAVADGYRTALAQPTYKPRGHAEFDDWVNSAVDSAETSRGAGEYIVKLARQAQSEGKQLSPVPKGFKSWADFSKNARKAAQQTFDESGSLYKVDLPDEHIAKMLDWDKPLSQQPKEVQAALKKTRSMLPPNAMDDLGGDLNLLYNPANTGADFLGTMNSLQPNLGETALRNAGIPGIRYLDGGSRGTGQGTSNFVVFPGNENLLQILERNGKPLNGLLD